MAILEASPDGTVHLPVPEQLRGGKIRVAATLEALEPSSRSEEMRKSEILGILAQLRARNPFRGIADPVAWQQSMREDVKLPGRE
ncbi:MAG TPA: hypothetical protein VGO11_09815 [Chthoniobacteraceae bacterium]|nr:hypothetical protein [Chthoniobacteraceae bacterium]